MDYLDSELENGLKQSLKEKYEITRSRRIWHPAISYKWYQTNYSKIGQINVNEIKEIIKQTSDNTQLYFYTQIVDNDMLGESIRTMISFGIFNGKSTCIFNMPDSQIAMNGINIKKIMLELEDNNE